LKYGQVSGQIVGKIVPAFAAEKFTDKTAGLQSAAA
jgi:hypothetical protein